MSKREFLQLAHVYIPEKHSIGHWYCSVKLDGMRAFWDGGLSRGLLAAEVPYANTAKDGRYVNEVRATGLWSRYGKVIHASEEWLDALPLGMNFDMELWMGNGTFQALRSTVSTLTPSVAGWKQVTGHVLDAPSWMQVLTPGELTGTNWKGYLHTGMMSWVEERCATVFPGFGTPDEAFRRIRQARELSTSAQTWTAHTQVRLPQHPVDAAAAVERRLQEVCEAGGEGLILRRAGGAWTPKRSHDVLKVKKLQDMEGTVTGFTWGRETELGSRHLGRMGALVLSIVGPKGPRRLELSGFTDEERAVHGPDDSEPLRAAGKDASSAWRATMFPIGSQVTFTYRDLSDDGIPKEARYLRKVG